MNPPGQFSTAMCSSAGRSNLSTNQEFKNSRSQEFKKGALRDSARDDWYFLTSSIS